MSGIYCVACGQSIHAELFENLRTFWRQGGSRELMQRDRKSPEAREWLRQADARRTTE